MKKNNIISLLLLSFFVAVSIHGVYAQDNNAASVQSIGDVCGNSSECTLADAQSIIGGLFKLIIGVGAPILVAVVIARIVISWWKLREGNSNAIKIAGQQAGQALLGFVVIVAISAGFYMAAVRFLGAQEWTTTLGALLSSSPQTQKAATSQPLGTPTPGAPKEGEPGSACSSATVPAGQLGTDRKTCYPGR